MQFLVENICKDMLGKRILNLILLFLFLIGMLVPLGSVSLVKNMWDNYRLSEYPHRDRLVIAEYFDIVIPGMEDLFYPSLKDMAGAEAEQAGVLICGSSVTTWRDTSASVMTAGCTEDFLDMNSYLTVEGKDPKVLFETGEKLCVLQSGSQMYADGVGIGEVITIDNTQFTVAGVINGPMIYGTVLMSYENMALLKENSRLQHQVLLRLAQAEKITRIRAAANEWFLAAGKEPLVVETGGRKDEVYRKSIEKNSGQKLAASGLLLLFTIISFFSIVSGILMQERKSFGTRLALGATSVHLRREIILRMELLLAAACMVDMLIYPLVFAGLGGVSRSVSWKTVLPVWGLFAFLVWILCRGMLGWSLRRTGIVRMLKEDV